MDLNRRDFIKGAVASAGALGISFPSKPFAGKGQELRVGYLPITDAAPLLIAHAKGYFEEEGLGAQRPIRVRSWSALAESFLSGKFNVTHMLLPMPIWMRFKNRIPVKVLAWDHTNGSAITVRGDSEMKEFADLGGRQIAVPHWYSIHNVILQMGLRKFGLKPVIQPQSAALAKDRVNIFMLSPSEMPAALAGRKIDGYIVAEPFNAIGELKTGARIMRFTGDIWKDHPCCVVVMNEHTSRMEPVFTQKVINAIVRAQLWIKDNLKKTALILSRQGKKYLPVSQEVLLKALTGYSLSEYGREALSWAIHHPSWKIGRIGFQPYPYPSATRFIIQEMQHTLMEGDASFLKGLSPGLAAKELVDDTYVKNSISLMGGLEKFGCTNIEHPWEREEIIEL